MSEEFSLKDHLFNKVKVTKLAHEIQAVYPQFDSERFISSTLSRFPELELKQRITYIAEMLKKYLPEEYPSALKIILSALPEKNDPNNTDNDYGDFIYAPYGEFIAKYGREKEFLNLSLDAIKEVTMRFSMEDAIRYFINDFPEITYKNILIWSADANYHVRRLASEGTRPKLPWSQKITVLTQQTLPILENLYSDSTRYVTRSVANHLNDLSKVDPELVVTTLKKWHKSGSQNEKEMNYITSHALRSLIKNGYDNAFKLLGYSQSAITILDFTLKDPVHINDYLVFSFSIIPTVNESVIIDYRIDFQNKKGEMKSKKIFKLKKVELKKDKPTTILKRHMMKEFMTTRTVYPGPHRLSLLINGKLMKTLEFELIRK